MNEPTNSDLAETLRRLETRLEVVARPYEDALADRLFTQTRDRLYKYIGLALFFVVPALGFLGFQSWRDMMTRVTTTANEVAQQNVKLEITDKLGPTIENAKKEVEKTTSRLKDDTGASSTTQMQTDLKTQYLLDDLHTRFETQLAAVRHKAEDQTKLLVEEFNKRVESLSKTGAPQVAKIEMPAAESPHTRTAGNAPQTDGWAYYGFYTGGKWTQSNFANQNKTHREPVIGDKVVVRIRSNARVDKMKYDSAGWHMAAIKGIMEEGTSATVRGLEKHDVDSDSAHYWIQFDSATKPLSPPDEPDSD